MATSGKIGFKGMKPSGNELTLPAGSTTDSYNCVMPSRDVIRTMRGMNLSTYIDNDSNDANGNRARELYQWGNHLFVNYTGSGGYKLALWSNWASSPSYALLGSYAPPEPTVTRMKFAQLARSAFWTTDAGLYRLDASGGTAAAAGRAPPTIVMFDGDGGLATRLSGNPSATGSWFSKNQTIGYRATCGKKDNNGRVIESEASGRVTVVNPNDIVITAGNLVRATNVMTATISAGHKFRVGDVFALSPGDSGGGADIAAGNYTVTSITSTTIVFASAGTDGSIAGDQTFSSGTKSVQVFVLLPPDAAAGDFIRLYRTDEAAGETTDPGDEVFLSYERLLSSTDISNGYAVLTDTTPTSFLGDPLDSNSNSGEGQLGVNTQPPLCRDICVWDGKLWGAQTTDRHRLVLRLLGTGSPNGLQSGDFLAVNTTVYDAGTDFELTTAYLPTENVDRTTRHMSYILGANVPGCGARQEYNGDTGLGEVIVVQDAPGSTLADGASGTIGAIYAATTRASAWADSLASLKAITEASTSRTGSTVTVRCTAHGFVQGQVIMLAYLESAGVDANFPAGLKTVASVVDANNFTYTEAGSASTMTNTYFAYATTYKSDNNKQLVRFSRPGLPDAWPLPNTIGGLPDGAEVLRIKPTPDNGELLVCLRNGDVYAIGGQYPYNVRRVDGSASLVAADTLVEHANQLHGLTTQGLCTISGSGIGLVGLDVEDAVRGILIDLASTADVSVPWALSYESERQYHLAMPLESPPGTITATNYQRFVLNSLRGEYTRAANFSGSRCGIVWKSGAGEYLVLGDVVFNRLRVERKTYANDGLDFAHEGITATVVGDQVGVSSIEVQGLGEPNVPVAGDVAHVGSAYYRITTATEDFITIDGTVTVTNGSTFTFYKQVGASIVFAVEAVGMPGIEKRFRELQLHFGKRLFERLTVTFADEHSTNTKSVSVEPTDFAYGTPKTRPNTIRVEVPQDMRSCAMLTVTLTLAEALSYFDLLGYSVTHEPISEKTGK